MLYSSCCLKGERKCHITKIIGQQNNQNNQNYRTKDLSIFFIRQSIRQLVFIRKYNQITCICRNAV